MLNRRSAIKTTLGGLLAWLGLSKAKMSTTVEGKVRQEHSVGKQLVEVRVVGVSADGEPYDNTLKFTTDTVSWKFGYRRDQVVIEHGDDGTVRGRTIGQPSFNLRIPEVTSYEMA